MTDIHIPQHIAIVMDGNRRWAKEHHLPVIEGHRRVATEILEPLVEYASKKGIKYVTFWAWSTENWKRPSDEVQGIMHLFRYIIQKKLDRLNEKGVCIKIIGDIDAFDFDIKEKLDQVVEKTKNNTKITAIFALNYGGRDEIIRAINRWHTAMHDTHDENLLTHDQFKTYLDTKDIPDPDLIIRTGGEQRLSGFLLWQAEYSEFYFPSWYMPEFTEEKLDEAIKEYNVRKRNFGK